ISTWLVLARLFVWFADLHRNAVPFVSVPGAAQLPARIAARFAGRPPYVARDLVPSGARRGRAAGSLRQSARNAAAGKELSLLRSARFLVPEALGRTPSSTERHEVLRDFWCCDKLPE